MDTERIIDGMQQYFIDQLGPEKYAEITEPFLEAARAMGELLRQLIEAVREAAGIVSEAMEELAEMAAEAIDADAPEWPRPQAVRSAAAAPWPLDQRQYVPP